MVSVREQDLSATLEHILAPLRTHARMGADRHEGGSQYFVVLGTKARRARARARRNRFELEIQSTQVRSTRKAISTGEEHEFM